MAYETAPEPADSKHVLLYKWAAAIYAGNGEAPHPDDSNRILWYKIALNS